MENETKAKLDNSQNDDPAFTTPTIDESDLPIPFKYKALAALILIAPFGFLIDGGQTFFLKMDWEYISKMTVLIGLLLYIVSVGKLARTFKDWDERRQT